MNAKNRQKRKESTLHVFDKMYETLKGKNSEVAEKILKDYYEINEFKKILVVDTIEEFASLLNYYSAKKDKEKYVFRGISSPEQKYCKITRACCLNCEKIDIKKYIENYFNKEILYIREFEHKAGYLLQNYHMPIDLVAAAQHYGIRTRLVDWTTSLPIATLFSLNGRLDRNKENETDERYYLVFAVNKNRHIKVHNLTTVESYVGDDAYSNRFIIYEKMLMDLMKIYMYCHDKVNEDRVYKFFENILAQTHTKSIFKNGGYNVDNLQSTLSTMIKRFKKNDIIFLETNFTNERIFNQRGLFQIIVDPSKEYMNNIIKEKVEIIMISEKIKENVLKYCDRIGINKYGLMPDLQAVATRINEQFD